MDFNHHMRHSAFADWGTCALTEWLNANGLSILKLREPRVASILFEERTRYLKEIFLGERIAIELQLAGADRDGSRWLVLHIFLPGATVCAYEAKGAWFSTATRRVVPAPPRLIDAFSNLSRTDDYADLSSGESVIEEVVA